MCSLPHALFGVLRARERSDVLNIRELGNLVPRHISLLTGPEQALFMILNVTRNFIYKTFSENLSITQISVEQALFQNLNVSYNSI